MKNLSDLNFLKNQINKNDSFSLRIRELANSLVNEAIIKIDNPKHSFVDFIEDIIEETLEVNFSDLLKEEDYNNANEHAGACLAITSQFKLLPKTPLLGSWLSEALKFTDYIILDYIQSKREDLINPDDYTGKKANLGEERQRYDKLKTYGQPISNAGAWLDKLYEIRNRIQHNTTVDKTSGVHTLKLPLYDQMNKSIKKHYPNTIKLMIHVYK